MAGEFGMSMLTDRLMPDLKANQASRALDKANQGALQEASQGPSFSETLKGALGQVNDALSQADTVAQNFAAGKGGNLHDVMIAMEKADVSLRTLTSVRSKLVEAYQEIMRMPV
ncbi:MAG: flagellar hook-basal body complex protein FliE [Bdellovibrionales bacterium]|nr:flagellar hook-basal body complex protein FliE [Bdellovibrionales bacterium]